MCLSFRRPDRRDRTRSSSRRAVRSRRAERGRVDDCTGRRHVPTQWITYLTFKIKTKSAGESISSVVHAPARGIGEIGERARPTRTTKRSFRDELFADVISLTFLVLDGSSFRPARTCVGRPTTLLTSFGTKKSKMAVNSLFRTKN